MKFTLTMDCGNASFEEERGRGPWEEVARILQDVADLLEQRERLSVGDDGRLRDNNGNTVGTWKLEE